jgi:hypothetical protein
MTDDVVQRRAAALEAAATPADRVVPEQAVADRAVPEQAVADRAVAALTPDERVTVDQLRSVLAHPAVWMEPPDLPVHPVAIDTALDPAPTSPAPDLVPPGPAPSRIGRPWRNLWRSRRLRWGLGTGGLAAAVAVALTTTLLPSRETVRFDLAGTAAAPAAHTSVTAVKEDAGWHIALDASDLPAAAEGTYYQGWVARGGSYVPLGTFHLRQPGKVELWAGVPVDEYSRLEITRQRVGGEQAPGELVLYGEIPSR